MQQNNDEWQNDDEDDYVSKSHFKRDAEARQDVGAELVNLNDAQLSRVPLDDELLAAIRLAQKLANKREAKRRQLQYIGKLMRSRDVEPISAALDRIKQRSVEANARFARLERLRDRLVNDGDAALATVLESYPQADRQHLRQLIRQARKADGSPDTATARTIFRYLRTLDEAQLVSDGETADLNDWADEANARREDEEQ